MGEKKVRTEFKKQIQDSYALWNLYLKYKCIRQKIAIDLNKMEEKQKNLTDIKEKREDGFQTENDPACTHGVHLCVRARSGGVCI